ncbi:MAG: MBL fold metallo-hydrolase [Gemmatimonadetes bacterium]|nr:MBL fold metallo-hydrolase [Gemmatimonadota bacterium]
MPSTTVYLANDIVRLRRVAPDAKGKHPLVATLFWGDRVTLVRKEAGRHVVRLPRREWNEATKDYDEKVVECFLPAKVTFRDDPLLKVRFVDVGQGDGAVIATPRGEVILIDGGEESHLRRYLSAAYSHILHTRPLHCRALVITHGDADHFAGLTDLARATRKKTSADPMITVGAVYHAGIVKGEKSHLGRTVKVGTRKYLTELHDDVRDLPDSRLNDSFRAWKAAFAALKTKTGGKVKSRRLVWGQAKAFDFLSDEGIGVEVLGPIVEQISGADAVPWLGDAGRTINGHSIVLKMKYGNVRFLFGADLNEPSEERLLAKAADSGVSLTAEVLKVPHHGSADFSPRMLEAIRPVVSVISSGDENVAKEYIHPRAGLVGALGKYARATVARPLIYVTEMVAFFKRSKKSFRWYEKTTFGIVHIRTDGTRVLAVTNSGRDDRKEAYAFRVDAQGDVAFEPEVTPI